MAGKPVVACDDDMMRFRSALEEAGYEVRTLHEAALDRVDAVVLSGMDSALVGDQRRYTHVPVVEAKGMSARQVVAALNERVRARM